MGNYSSIFTKNNHGNVKETMESHDPLWSQGIWHLKTRVNLIIDDVIPIIDEEYFWKKLKEAAEISVFVGA